MVFDYVQWLTRERGVNVRTEGVVIRSIMAAAKCLWRNESKVSRLCCLPLIVGCWIEVSQVGAKVASSSAPSWPPQSSCGVMSPMSAAFVESSLCRPPPFFSR